MPSFFDEVVKLPDEIPLQATADTELGSFVLGDFYYFSSGLDVHHYDLEPHDIEVYFAITFWAFRPFCTLENGGPNAGVCRRFFASGPHSERFPFIRSGGFGG